MSEGYNGWSNYETWCVSLWLSNDEGLYEHTRIMARAAWGNDVDGSAVGGWRTLSGRSLTICRKSSH